MVKWQTREFQKLVIARSYPFESDRGHHHTSRCGGMADAAVLKTVGPQGSCEFDSRLRDHTTFKMDPGQRGLLHPFAKWECPARAPCVQITPDPPLFAQAVVRRGFGL